jgi:hypothetical protein
MGQNRNDRRDNAALTSLEAGLRRLPELEVPEALEAKLLATIPAGRRRPTPRGVFRGRVAWGAGALAAAAGLILAAILMSRTRPPEPPAESEPGRTLLAGPNGVSPRYVLPKPTHRSDEETRPCDILPPLPDWH